MNFKSLGIMNGIIDESIQAEGYYEFAVNNTYGIKVSDHGGHHESSASHKPRSSDVIAMKRINVLTIPGLQ